jgi:hypothetical protein
MLSGNKMAKPIGRIYFNETCLSGYIIVGNNFCVKFGIPITNGVEEKNAWIYPSKKEE